MTGVSPAVGKALSRLQASLEAGQPYEGHELFKTVFHRFRARKLYQDSYGAAEGGAIAQLQKGQVNCGTELGCMLVDAYVTDACPATQEAVQRVLNIMEAFPTQPHGEDEEPPIDRCTKVVSAAVKWLKKVDGLEWAPKIYGTLAAYITKCLDWMGLGIAMPYYARSQDLSAFAVAVAAAAAHGTADEEDLFIVRAVLHTACSRPAAQGSSGVTSLSRARELLEKYSAAAGHAVPETPLLHFLDLFLEALEKRASPLVDVLLKKYEVSLQRDPSMVELVERAREMFAPAPIAPMPGMFGSLFRSMMMPAAT